MKLKNQKKLFDEQNNDHLEWDDMPEFVQEKQEPFSIINVRFDTEKDLQDFAKIIGQKLTNKTKSIWHPYKSHWGGLSGKLRWFDES